MKDLVLYLILYNLLFPIIYSVFYILSFFSKKIRKNRDLFRGLTKEQLKKIQKIKTKKPVTLWFHASSVGEYEQARILAKKFREKEKNLFILISVFSVSGYEQRKDDHFADIFFVLPFDFFFTIKRLIKQIYPNMVFYSRYDVWPNMVHHLKKIQSLQFLFSAQISKNSGRLRYPLFPFYKNLYQKMDRIFVTDIWNQSLFNRFTNKLSVMGDTRYEGIEDKILATSENKDFIHFKKMIRSNLNIQKKIFIAGSSYFQSEKLLLMSFKQYNLFSNYHLILVPHHTNKKHISDILSLAKNMNLSIQTFSDMRNQKFEKYILDKQITLIDTMGILTQLYSIANIAYVGGGFEGSVHTVIEPVYFGIPVITGPYISNSREAMELKEKDLLFTLQNNSSKEIYHLIQTIEKKQNFLRKELKGYFSERVGASEKIYHFIKKLKDKNSFPE